MDARPEMGFFFPPPMLAWLAATGCEEIALVMPTQAGPDGPHWLEFDLDMGSDPGGSAVLFLRMRDPAALDLHGRLLLADYLTALRPFLDDVTPQAAHAWLTLPRATVVDVEHQLRNHLNSLFMNAGMLGLRCDDRTDIQVVFDQMESDARGCLDQMQRLFPPRT